MTYAAWIGAYIALLAAIRFWLVAKRKVKEAARMLQEAREEMDDAKILWASIRERNSQIWIPSQERQKSGGPEVRSTGAARRRGDPGRKL